MLAFHTQYKDEDEYENKTLVSHWTYTKEKSEYFSIRVYLP
jgi:hypothetical protein